VHSTVYYSDGWYQRLEVANAITVHCSAVQVTYSPAVTQQEQSTPILLPGPPESKFDSELIAPAGLLLPW
jgi:hypothetical protein